MFAPTCGGRLLSLVTGGRELLWHNPDLLDRQLAPRVPIESWPDGSSGMGSWANVGGSKTWPAPQGWAGGDDWPGPPDPVLDGGPWSTTVEERAEVATVSMRSEADPYTGLRIERLFAIPDEGSSFEETIRLRNVSNRTVRWAPWEVCQVTTGRSVGFAGAPVLVPGSSGSDVRDLGTYEGDIAPLETEDGVRFQIGTGVGKRGVMTTSPEIEYRDPDGVGLRMAVVSPSAGTYPDRGCSVEVWLQRPLQHSIEKLGGLRPRAHLAELELLGPLRTLSPGDTSTMTIRWTVLDHDAASA